MASASAAAVQAQKHVVERSAEHLDRDGDCDEHEKRDDDASIRSLGHAEENSDDTLNRG